MSGPSPVGRVRSTATRFGAAASNRVIIAESIAVFAGLALLGAEVPHVWALAAAALLALIPFLTVRRKPIFDWVRVCSRYVFGRVSDIGVTTEHLDSSGRPVGVHWQRETVTCTMEVLAPLHDSTVLGRASADTRHTLPIEALAACFRQHDIEVCAIDVLASGSRSADGSVAADVYEELIGPLPAVASRSIWVSVTIDMRVNAAAVRARGGGRSGAARTAVMASTRVVRVLHAHGLPSRLLSRAELETTVLDICRGVHPQNLTQTWSTAPLPGAYSTGFGIDCAAITAEEISSLWAVPSLETSIAFHFRPARDERRVVVSASCRYVTRSPMTRPRVRALRSMAGSQRDCIFSHLPLAVPALAPLTPCRELDATSLERLALPVSGCGQLLGSDSAGNGVAVRLFGPTLARVRIVGELYLAQQLLFRAVATGARVLIRSDRPHAWRALVDTLGSPDRISLEGNASRPQSTYNVILTDCVDEPPSPTPHQLPGLTEMILTEHAPQGNRIEHETGDRGSVTTQPQLSIVQPHASGDRIHIRSGPLAVALTLVTIPSETAIIGRPRSVRSAVRS